MEPITYTTIVVGPDGKVFDLSQNEYPPTTKEDAKYIPWFGLTCTIDYCAKLKKLSANEVITYLKHEMYS